MIKPNSLLRRKWFQITAATVGGVVVAGGAVGGGVAAAIIDVATKRAKETVSDLGITPDPGTKSNIDLGRFATAESRLNVVSLGDSVTAGYTTLSYTKEIPGKDKDGNDIKTSVVVDPKIVKDGQKQQDTLSYADYVAINLSKSNKLASYNSLAVSGQTSSGMLDTLTKAENLPIIAKADLVMITIGANDILRAVKMLGVPFSSFQEILANPFGSTTITTNSKSEALGKEVITPITTTVSNINYLPALFSSLQDVLTNGPEKLFSVDTVTLDTELVNALSNVLKALTFIHQKSPGAKIILNEYQFPFNRFVHDGKNITDFEDPALAAITFNGKSINKNTLRGVYDYVMDNFKDKATAAFGVVTWNSLQDNQDELIKKLKTDKDANNQTAITTDEQGVELFQKDITDIHPTEYSHALIGQHIFNTYLASNLLSDKQEIDYAYLRTAIQGSTLGAERYPLIAFFKFILGFKKEEAGSEGIYTFVKSLVDKMVDEVKIAAQVESLDKIDITNQSKLAALLATSSFGLLQTLGPILGNTANSTQQAAFLRAFDKFINTMIFDANDKTLFNLFTQKVAVSSADAAPEFTLAPEAENKIGFYRLLGTFVNEAAAARVNPFSSYVVPYLQRFVADAVLISDADKRSLENTLKLTSGVFGTTNAPLDNADKQRPAIGAMYLWLFRLPAWPSGSDPYPPAPASIKASLATMMNLSRSAIRTNAVFATAAAKLVAMSQEDKATFLAALKATNRSLDDVPDTVLMLIQTFQAGGLPPNADGYTGLPAQAKETLALLIEQLNDGVKYANALAKVFPAAFFANYTQDKYSRELTFADLMNRGAGTISLITKPAAA